MQIMCKRDKIKHSLGVPDFCSCLVYSTSVVRLLKFMGFQTIASYTGILEHIFAVGARADHCNGLPRGKVLSSSMSSGVQNRSVASTTEAGLLSS